MKRADWQNKHRRIMINGTHAYATISISDISIKPSEIESIGNVYIQQDKYYNVKVFFEYTMKTGNKYTVEKRLALEYKDTKKSFLFIKWNSKKLLSNAEYWNVYNVGNTSEDTTKRIINNIQCIKDAHNYLYKHMTAASRLEKASKAS